MSDLTAIDILVDPDEDAVDRAREVNARVLRSMPGWVLDDTHEPRSNASANNDDLLARAVFAGEADGRWLWLVMKPASAALLLHDDWLLADVTGFGPEALEMPFGGPRPAW